jgi:hypothetical protein
MANFDESDRSAPRSNTPPPTSATPASAATGGEATEVTPLHEGLDGMSRLRQQAPPGYDWHQGSLQGVSALRPTPPSGGGANEAPTPSPAAPASPSPKE